MFAILIWCSGMVSTRCLAASDLKADFYSLLLNGGLTL